MERPPASRQFNVHEYHQMAVAVLLAFAGREHSVLQNLPRASSVGDCMGERSILARLLDDGWTSDRALAAIELFWLTALVSQDDSDDSEPEPWLQIVATAEGRHRLDPEPDQNPFDPLKDAFGTSRFIVAQHLSGALALQTRFVHGRTDDYLDSCRRAYSLGSYLRLESDTCLGQGPQWISAKGVHAAVLLERYETERLDGRPSAALSGLTEATQCFQDAMDGAYGEADDTIESLSRDLSLDEVKFFSGDLKDTFRTLVAVRNPAQHEHTKQWRREEVEPLFRQFLGIGTNGTLCALLTIWSNWRARQAGN